MKLGNIMRVEIFNMNFSIKDSLICIKNQKEKSLVHVISGITLCLSCTVNLEFLKLYISKKNRVAADYQFY